MMAAYWVMIFLGLAVGISSSLLGLGGAVFTIPIMHGAVDLTLRQVIGTSVFAVMLATGTNLYFFARARLVEWKMVTRMAPVLAVFSFVTAKLSVDLNEELVLGLFSFLMILMVLKLVTKVFDLFFKEENFRSFHLYFVSMLSGTFSGLLGIGTGLLLGPTLLGFRLVPHQKVSPTVNGFLFVSCFFASLGNLSFDFSAVPLVGNVHLYYAGVIYLLSLLGSYWGRRMNLAMSEDSRKKLIAVTLVVLTVRLWI